MAIVMLEIVDGFSFVWVSPDVQAFKVVFLQVTFILNWSNINISKTCSNSNFAHSFDFHCLANFAKKYQFVEGSFSLVWVIMGTFNSDLESMDNDTNSAYYKCSFTKIQNLKLLAKLRTLNVGTSESYRRKTVKFPTLHSPFCLFLIDIL